MNSLSRTCIFLQILASFLALAAFVMLANAEEITDDLETAQQFYGGYGGYGNLS
jgi:hypothetical protein